MQFHKTGVYRELPSGVGIGHYNLGRSLRMVSIMFVLNSLFLFWVTLQLAVSPSVLALSPSVTLNQILAEVSYGIDVMRRLPWLDPLLKSPSLDPLLESSLLDSLLESPSLDPIWCLHYSTVYWILLCSTLQWSLLHLTLSDVFFIRLTTGVSFARPSLESSSLDPVWNLLYSTLYWNFRYLTFWSLLYSTFYWGVLVWLWVTCNWQSVSRSVRPSVLSLRPSNSVSFVSCLYVWASSP